MNYQHDPVDVQNDMNQRETHEIEQTYIEEEQTYEQDDEHVEEEIDEDDVNSELSLHFICIEHPNEEYCYYSPGMRKLLCTKCLLNMASNGVENDARPLRKCLP